MKYFVCPVWLALSIDFDQNLLQMIDKPRLPPCEINALINIAYSFIFQNKPT